MNLKSEEKLQDSGYSRIANILSGLVPTVKTFGILTAENPQAEQASAAFNNEQNKKLESHLRDGGYGFIPVKGHYGDAEKSYFIPNITKWYVTKVGTMYKQDIVIFGELRLAEKNENGSYPFKVEMIKTYPKPDETEKVIGRVDGVAEGFVNAEDEKDMFTGRKFNLDFLFDSMPTVWEAEHGALKITDTMPAEFIEKVNNRSDSSDRGNMYGWYCRKAVQAHLYRFEGKELPNRKVAVVKVTRPDKPFANLEEF